jgi:hypothetical protein
LHRAQDAVQPPAGALAALAAGLVVLVLAVLQPVHPVGHVLLVVLVVLLFGVLQSAQPALQPGALGRVLAAALVLQAVQHVVQVVHGGRVGVLARLGAVAGAVASGLGRRVGLGVLVRQLGRAGVLALVLLVGRVGVRVVVKFFHAVQLAHHVLDLRLVLAHIVRRAGLFVVLQFRPGIAQSAHSVPLTAQKILAHVLAVQVGQHIPQLFLQLVQVVAQRPGVLRVHAAAKAGQADAVQPR